MKVGLVCPYTWDVPGGVQAHVHDLAIALIGLGHHVSVITPADDEAALPPYITSTGRAVPVPYNGAVARMSDDRLRKKSSAHQGRIIREIVRQPQRGNATRIDPSGFREECRIARLGR